MKKLIIILGVVGVSLSAPLVRISSAPAMILAFYRVAMAGVLLLPYVLLRNREELKGMSRKDWNLALTSGVCLGLHFSLYFESLRYTSIASSVVFVDTEVFFVAMIMLVIFKEKIPPLGWAGILATFLGSVIIALSDSGSGGGALLGDMIALAGAVVVAIYTIIGKVLRQRISTTTYTLLVYIAASVTVLILLLVNGIPLTGYQPVDYWAAFGMAVFCTLLGHSIFSWGLKYESAAFISNSKLLEPVFASLIGIALFREIPRPAVILGGLIVIGGVFLYTRVSDSKSS